MIKESYDHCHSDSECHGKCIMGDAPNDTKMFCASPCMTDMECDPPPDGDAVPRCIQVPTMTHGVVAVCALTCDGGETCPMGRTCILDSDNDGPVSLCL